MQREFSLGQAQSISVNLDQTQSGGVNLAWSSPISVSCPSPEPADRGRSKWARWQKSTTEHWSL